jgi:AhpD family alkylhydroperoxidase
VIVSGTHVCNLCVKSHISQGIRYVHADQNRVS